MDLFLYKILPLLRWYREFLRKVLGEELARNKIYNLKISKRQLRALASVQAYEIAKEIYNSDDLKEETKDDNSNSYYSGVKAFKKELSTLLQEFIVRNDLIIENPAYSVSLENSDMIIKTDTVLNDFKGKEVQEESS